MESVALVTRLVDILSGNGAEVAKFYSAQLETALERKRIWDNDKIRVGVVGVTSSGKSTLINALLGCEILSSAVVPSSGQLVCCSYGEKSAATIRFEDGRPSVQLTKQKFCLEELKKYSDERENPENKKCVRSIELQSPDFDLGREVLLIDSPGLDAYGLEAHEKLTLETLLPTIDVCIYVTTAKTNSDRKTADMLMKVKKYDCPLVIVQNMLDSIRASADGKKSSEQVAREHYDRVKKIVSQAGIKGGKVKIVQMSAKNAGEYRIKKKAVLSDKDKKDLEEGFRQSHYDEFVKLTKECLQMCRPEIEATRIKCIKGLVEDARSALQNKKSEMTSGEKNGSAVSGNTVNPGLRKELDNFIKDLDKEYGKIIGEGKEKGEIYRSELIWLNQENAKQKAEKINRLVEETGEKVADMVSKGNLKIKKYAESLQIPDRDLNSTYSAITGSKVEVTEKQQIILREEEGLKGEVKRWIADSWLGSLLGKEDWGRVREEKNVVDVETTKKNLEERLDHFLILYDKSFWPWYKQQESSIAVMRAELERREADVRKKAEMKISRDKLVSIEGPLDKLWKEICTVLSKLEEQCRLLRDNSGSKGYRQGQSLNKFDADRCMTAMMKLAQQAMKDQHRAVMRFFIEAKGLSEAEAWAVGWDRGSMERFEAQAGIRDLRKADLSQDPQSLSGLQRAGHGRRVVFVMVNAIQIGAALKQIAELRLASFLNKKDCVVWTIQDFEELLHGDSDRAGAVVDEIQRWRAGSADSFVWLVHENPIYSLCMFACQQHSDQLAGPADEEKFLRDIEKKYRQYYDEDGNVDVVLGKLIRRQP